MRTPLIAGLKEGNGSAHCREGEEKVKIAPFLLPPNLTFFFYLSAMSEAAANVLSLSERSSQKGALAERSHCQTSAQRSNLVATEKPFLANSRKLQWLHTLRACYEKPTHSRLKRRQRFCSLQRGRRKGEDRTFSSPSLNTE